MQRTANPMAKHPSYGNRPIPAMQLMSKLSSFQGQRTDQINQRAYELKGQSPDQQPPLNANNAQPFPTMADIKASIPPVGAQARPTFNDRNPLDPNQKPMGQATDRPETAHRSQYDTHMNSSMGKILLSQPEKLPPEVHIPGKKLQDPTVSNFNNTVIGGQAPSGDPFLTTQQMMNAGEAFEQKHQSRKKMLRPFEPELFTSPITGEPIANYGTWADDLKKQQSDVGLKKEPEDEEDDDKNDPIMGKLKSQLKLRGAKGIVGLGRLFKIMDDDGSRTLSFAEFKKAMKEFGMVLSDSELIILFKRFDISKAGAISYNDFITTLSGRLNSRRKKFVHMAFNILDKDKSGVLDVSDIAFYYNTSAHPDVISGKKTNEQVLQEFLQTFEGSGGGERDGLITLEEFEAYYKAISASIDNDAYFELMMRNAWHISGGEGEAANSANRRVLVTHSDGTQSVVEIENDMGLKPNDTAGMIQRLRAQGVDVRALSTFDSGGDDSGPVAGRSRGGQQKRPSTAGALGRGPSRGDESGLPPSNSPNRKKKVLLGNRGGNNDLTAVQQSSEPSAGLLLIIQRIKAEMKKRGSTGFVGMQRRFKIMDDDGSGALSLSEFKKAMREMQLDLTESDLRNLFEFFDSDRSGSIDFNEFIQGVREPMNPGRLKLVHMAFTILDKDNSGEVDASEIASCYDASKHPEVLAKRKTPAQVLREFLDTFDVGGVKDGKVTRREFENYYANLSANIDNDDYFELMMRNAWHIAGGAGQSANSSNLTVLVTDSSGATRTVMLQNDLGVKKDDIPQIVARLRQQGVTDVKAINGKVIKLQNVNGVDVVQTTNQTLQDVNHTLQQQGFDKAPKVQRAPPFQPHQPGQQRPRTAGAISSSSSAGVNGGAKMRPIAVPEAASKYGPSSASLKTAVPQLAQGVLQNLHSQAQRQQTQRQIDIVGATLLEVLRTQLLARGPAGIIELQRTFQRFDTDRSQSIDMQELQEALRTLQITFAPDQVQTLFQYLDKDSSGAIDFQELLEGLRGPLSPEILVLVHRVFDTLDPQQSNAIAPATLLANYDAARHPLVSMGIKTAEEIENEFLQTFDVGSTQVGIVTRDDFVTYYHNVAAALNDDDFLVDILQRAWHLTTTQQQQQQQQAQQQQFAYATAYNSTTANATNNHTKVQQRLSNAQQMAQEYWGAPPPSSSTFASSSAPVQIQAQSQYQQRPSTVGGGSSVRRPSTAASGGGGYGVLSSGNVRGMGAAGGHTGGNAGGNLYPAPPVQIAAQQLLVPPSADQAMFNVRGSQQQQGSGGGGGGGVWAQNYQNYNNAPAAVQRDRLQAMQKEAVLQFNAGHYDQAERQFRSLLPLVQAVYPPNHPECLKVEKSILMVQRKAQHPM